MITFNSTDLGNKTGDVLYAAATGIVSIIKHGKPRFVILSQERYERLIDSADTRRSVHVDELTDDEANRLVAKLQASIEND